MPQVLLLYGSGGGGHKASAIALQLLLTSIPNLTIDIVDASSMAGAAAGDWLYNLLLSYNAISLIDAMHNAIQTLFPLALPRLRAIFRSYWPRVPHLTVVVSFIPILNAVFADTLPAHIHLFTVLTDFSHTDVHPWIQHVRQHLVAGTSVAYAQALSAGYLPTHRPSASMVVSRTSGMVVAPRFYTRASVALRSHTAARMDFNPAQQTYLLLFGGAPPTDLMSSLVAHLTNRPNAVNIIAVCGRNKLLRDRLQRRKLPHQTLYITGFTTQIPLYMQISDILIGKPGPGVVSEAFVSRLPCVLVVASESAVMKQEHDVLDWVRRNHVGMVVSSAKEAAAISCLQISQMRAAIAAAPPNNAVFEVRDLILNSLGLLQTPRPPHSPEVETHSTPGDCDIADDNLSLSNDSINRKSPLPSCPHAHSLSPTTITSVPHRSLHRPPLPSSRIACDAPSMARALDVEPPSSSYSRRSPP